MRFKGQLLVPTESGPGLRVDLEVAGHHLAVESDGSDLGAWPLDAVRVRRLEGDIFAMTVAGEDLHFVADDTISFAYTGIPAIEGIAGPATSRSRIRGWLGRISGDEPRPQTPRGPAPRATPVEATVEADEPPDQPPVWLEERAPELDFDFDAKLHVPEAEEDEVVDVSNLAEETHRAVSFLPDRPEPVQPAAAPEPVEESQTCRGITAENLPCRSPVLTSTGYCYAHDPERPVDDGYRRAQEARARLRRKGTAKLNRVYSRLDKAMRQVERGELEPDIAMAMAQLALTMCAILDLDQGDELGNDEISPPRPESGPTAGQ